VAAVLACAAERYDIGTGFNPVEGERRLVRIDGHPARGATALAPMTSRPKWTRPA